MKVYKGLLSGKGKKFGIVVARFNDFITKRLLESALDVLEQAEVRPQHIETVWVPGALEIPYYCQKLAKRGTLDGLIALGCVLRGGTYHFETVSHEVTRGIAQVALEQDLPIATGIITADTLEQAIDRAGLKAGNKGGHAALAALELVSLNKKIIQKK